MTDDELRAISANWLSYPIVDRMPDGAEVRNLGDSKRKAFFVREPSGYFCSPIAYSVRAEHGGSGRRHFTPKWADNIPLETLS